MTSAHAHAGAGTGAHTGVYAGTHTGASTGAPTHRCAHIPMYTRPIFILLLLILSVTQRERNLNKTT